MDSVFFMEEYGKYLESDPRKALSNLYFKICWASCCKCNSSNSYSLVTIVKDCIYYYDKGYLGVLFFFPVTGRGGQRGSG